MTDPHNGSFLDPLGFHGCHPNRTCEEVTYQIKLDAAPPKRLGGSSYLVICLHFPTSNSSIPHKLAHHPGARDSTNGEATSSKKRCADSAPGWSLRQLMARNSDQVQQAKKCGNSVEISWKSAEIRQCIGNHPWKSLEFHSFEGRATVTLVRALPLPRNLLL